MELKFVDNGSNFLSKEDFEQLHNGDFEWQPFGNFSEEYYAGIDFAGAANGTDSTAISILRLDKQTQQRQAIFAVELRGMTFPQQIKTILSLFSGPRMRFRCKQIVADATGCGLGVIQVLKDQGLNIIPITFNAKDKYTHTNTNYKTTMYRAILSAIQNDKFKYPNVNNIPSKDSTLYHKILMEWSDLEVSNITGSNNLRISNENSNDDFPDSSTLAYFGTIIEQKQHKMPSGITYRSNR